MRFSGHDTFHCKEQWLLKGLQLVNNQGYTSFLKNDEAIGILGVGKNMVRSFHFWLKAFHLLDEQDNLTDYANLVFLTEKHDPYLEKESSLWLLQYLLCSKNYATIYPLIFSDYFQDKVSFEFSEFQIVSFISRILNDKKIKKFTPNTLKSDYNVFLKTYVLPQKNIKTIEDDYSTPLISLKLISRTNRKNHLNQNIYRLEKKINISLSEQLFGFCLLDLFKDENAINFEQIQQTLGSFFCLSTEGLEEVVSRLCDSHKEFVYKNDAGVRQIQIKNTSDDFKKELFQFIYK